MTETWQTNSVGGSGGCMDAGDGGWRTRRSSGSCGRPRPTILTEMRRIGGELDVDLVAAHLDGPGRPRLRVTQDDTGTAAILSEARIYSDAGAVAELIEGQLLPADALTPGATIKISSAWPRNGRIYGPRGAARALGLKPGTLQSRLRKLDIDREQFIREGGDERRAPPRNPVRRSSSWKF